jgi:hypothetical protein
MLALHCFLIRTAKTDIDSYVVGNSDDLALILITLANSSAMTYSTLLSLCFILSAGFASALAAAAAAAPKRSYLVTGANKGQGYALCKRILSEYGDTHGKLYYLHILCCH